MYFILTIAIISTMLWLNITIAQIINTVNDSFDEKTQAVSNDLKNRLVFVMGMFWSAFLLS